VSCAKTADPIDLPFGLWTRMGQRKHWFNRVRQVAPICPHGRANWRHLAITIEPSVCCDDAACQITLTTCYKFIAQSDGENFFENRLAFGHQALHRPVHCFTHSKREKKWSYISEAALGNTRRSYFVNHIKIGNLVVYDYWVYRN